jgi:hypothetical protein
MNGGQNESFFDGGIFLHDGIKLSVGDFYANS